ncbi:MAG: hypothetical protein H0T89_30535 [Deltaproteobacteria bacterium]|nr:hypothetical protein [Deltaproteobacteria bacterium]MDQ3300016.1 hypothetical protein [Myxococcota bacterium]
MHKLLALSLAVLAGCPEKKEDYKNQAPPPEPEKPASLPPPPVKKAEAPKDLGTCKLTASGAVTAEQTTPGGRPATNVSYWYDEAEKKNMMGVDGFVVNCNGPDIRFSLVPGGGKVDGMPFKPKKYEFKAGKGDANLMIGFGKATMDKPSGSVDITAFDGRHIAGTVDLEGKLVPGAGTVKLTGSFDLVCPGFKGCVYE